MPRSFQEGLTTLRLAAASLATLLACGGPSPETDAPSQETPSYGGTAIVATGSDFDVFNELATTPPSATRSSATSCSRT